VRDPVKNKETSCSPRCCRLAQQTEIPVFKQKQEPLAKQERMPVGKRSSVHVFVLHVDVWNRRHALPWLAPRAWSLGPALPRSARPCCCAPLPARLIRTDQVRGSQGEQQRFGDAAAVKRGFRYRKRVGGHHLLVGAATARDSISECWRVTTESPAKESGVRRA
jgi:hypothetical protein